VSVVQLDPGRPWLSALTRVVRRAVLVAVTVAVVDVTFGYAITGVHDDVLAGAGSGLAIGVGLSLRMGCSPVSSPTTHSVPSSCRLWHSPSESD